MSTSLLYHAFGIRGYEYVRTEYQDGQMIFTIQPGPQRLPLLGLRRRRGHVAAGTSSGGSDPCPSAAGRPSWSCPSRASNVRPAAWCARSRSPSPTPGGATPRPSSDTPWSCRGA